MPIFEDNEPIDEEDFRRQQKSLNNKVRKKNFADSYENMVNQSFPHFGGDCWKDEEFEESLKWLMEKDEDDGEQV